MATEDRVKVLEGEFKLIKSELRQTLSSVRDFLLDFKLPPVQEEPGVVKQTESETNTEENNQKPDEQQSGLDDPGGDGVDGDGYSPAQDQMADASEGDQPFGQSGSGQEPADECLPPLDSDLAEGEELSSGDMPGQTSDEDSTDGNQTEEENLDGTDQNEDVDDGRTDDRRATTPQVNMLASLIRWVALAKKEIGSSQLPVFLNVYATTGGLSDEMKEIILHLAEVTTNPNLSDETPDNGQVISEQVKLCMEINRSAPQLPEDVRFKLQRLTELLMQQSMSYNKADIWSMLMVDLQGILTGGGASMRSIQNFSRTLKKLEFKEQTEDFEDTSSDLNNNDDFSNPGKDTMDAFTFDEPSDPSPITLKGTRPARLRLIMPVGEGQEQELDLGNLFIARDEKINLPKILKNRSR
jgi:hypothetical protein